MHQQSTRLPLILAEVGLARDEGLVALAQLCVQLPTEINRNKTVEKAGGHHKKIHIHFINEEKSFPIWTEAIMTQQRA